MRSLFLLSLSIVFLVGCEDKEPQPFDATAAIAADAPDEWLPIDMAELEGTPDYALRQRLPAGGLRAFGDFDGDGATDLAFLSRNAATQKYAVSVMLTSKTTQTNQMLGEGALSQAHRMALGNVPAGQYKTACGKGAQECAPGEPAGASLANAGFALTTLGSATRIFWWDGKAFQSARLSD